MFCYVLFEFLGVYFSFAASMFFGLEVACFSFYNGPVLVGASCDVKGLAGLLYGVSFLFVG